MLWNRAKRMLAILLAAAYVPFSAMADESSFENYQTRFDWKSLQDLKIDIKSCNKEYVSEAECKELAQDFLQSVPFKILHPTAIAASRDDPTFDRIFPSCIRGGFQRLATLIVDRISAGALGPFALYELESAAAPAGQLLEMVALRGFHSPGIADNERFPWTGYVLLDAAACSYRYVVALAHGEFEQRSRNDYTDGVVILGGSTIIFSIDWLGISDAPFTVQFWIVDSSKRTTSVAVLMRMWLRKE